MEREKYWQIIFFLRLNDFREDPVPYLAFYLKGFGVFFCTLFIFVLLPTSLEALYISKSLELILLRTVQVNMCIKPNWSASKQ